MVLMLSRAAVIDFTHKSSASFTQTPPSCTYKPVQFSRYISFHHYFGAPGGYCDLRHCFARTVVRGMICQPERWGIQRVNGTLKSRGVSYEYESFAQRNGAEVVLEWADCAKTFPLSRCIIPLGALEQRKPL